MPVSTTLIHLTKRRGRDGAGKGNDTHTHTHTRVRAREEATRHHAELGVSSPRKCLCLMSLYPWPSAEFARHVPSRFSSPLYLFYSFICCCRCPSLFYHLFQSVCCWGYDRWAAASCAHASQPPRVAVGGSVGLCVYVWACACLCGNYRCALLCLDFVFCFRSRSRALSQFFPPLFS